MRLVDSLSSPEPSDESDKRICEEGAAENHPNENQVGLLPGSVYRKNRDE